jgi:hypothetical protein
MNKNNAKDYLPFVQALAEGKTIQVNLPHTGWEDLDGDYNIDFGRKPECYRIKSEITKWWIMPNFDWDEPFNPSIGLNYFVEEQKESYSRNRPPLKSDFDSKKEAEKWLNNYLFEESVFQSAAKRFEIFSAIMSDYVDRFKNHKQLEKEYLKFKIHEFLEDVDKMDELLWTKDKEKGEKE